MSHDAWRELAEKATKEQDPEKLMAIVEELNGELFRREAAAQKRKFELIALRRDLSRAEQH